MQKRVNFVGDDAPKELPQSITDFRFGQSGIDEEDLVLDDAGRTRKEEYILQGLGVLDALDDEEYVAYVEAIVSDSKHLSLENSVLYEYLKGYEPNLIADLSRARELIYQLESEMPLMPTILGFSQEPDTPLAELFSDLGPRLNVSQRHDLVMRFMEDTQESLMKFVKHSNIERGKHLAVIEEAGIRLQELQEQRDAFEAAMEAAVDPITQRIPAEKFVLYMDEHLKHARQITEKYRLRNNSLNNEYRKAKAALEKRIELGMTLHVVDFDKYIIQNKYLKEKIDLSNKNLLQLKRRTGQANLDLTLCKTYLSRLVAANKDIQDDIHKCEVDEANFRREREIARKQLDDALAENQAVKTLIKTTRAPEPLDYLRVKTRLHELQKIQKFLTRKENLVKITMNTTLKSMKKLSGSKTVKKEWFEQCSAYDDDDTYFDADSPSIEGLEATASTDLGEFDIFKVIKCTPTTSDRDDPESAASVATGAPKKYLTNHGKHILQ